jgi:hypothetical protein
MYDSTVFSFTWIEHEKLYTTEEVIQVNRILKARAARFVAASEECNLYPENCGSNQNWSELDSLFQPSFPSHHTSTEVHFGFENGNSKAFNAFGEEIEAETDEIRARLDALLKRDGYTSSQPEE